MSFVNRFTNFFHSNIPNDLDTVHRLKSYSTVVGAVLLHIVIGATALGNLVTYMTSYMRLYVSTNNNYSQNIWLSSVGVMAFTMFTIAGGYMTRRVPFKVVVFLGIAIISLGNYLTALALDHSFMLLLLTFGFLQSAGGGLIYSNAIVTSAKWHPHRKGFITGLIIALNSVSSFFAMQIQTMYFNPENVKPDTDGYFIDTTVLSKVPIYFKASSLVFLIIGAVGSLITFVPSLPSVSFLAPSNSDPVSNGGGYGAIEEGNDDDRIDETCHLLESSSSTSSGFFPAGSNLAENLIENDILGILKEEFDRAEELLTSKRFETISQSDGGNSENTPIIKNYYGVRRALRTRMAMILFITFGLSTESSYFIAAMGKPFGQTFIFDDHYLALIVSLSNIANCFGSFFCGRLLDHLKFKRTMILVNAVVSASYFSFIFCVYYSPKLLYAIWSMVINFASIGFFSSHLPEVMTKFGDKHATAIYGLIHIGPVISSLALSPIMETLMDTFGYFSTFLTVGFLNMISMIIIMIFYRAHTVI